MRGVLLDAWQDWYCPNCDFTERTRPVPVNGTRFHPCPGLHGLTAPSIRAGTQCKVIAEVRADYLRDSEQRRGDDGKPYMAVRTTRDDGEDLAVFPEPAVMKGN